MDAASTAKTNHPTPICNKPKSSEPDSEAQPRGYGAAGRSVGRGEMRVTGRSPTGATPRTTTQAGSPLRLAGWGASGGGAGRGAGPLTAMPPGRGSLRWAHPATKNPWRTTSPGAPRAEPGRHAPGLNSRPPPLSRSSSGRAPRGGCRERARRWVPRGLGRGAQV